MNISIAKRRNKGVATSTKMTTNLVSCRTQNMKGEKRENGSRRYGITE